MVTKKKHTIVKVGVENLVNISSDIYLDKREWYVNKIDRYKVAELIKELDVHSDTRNMVLAYAKRNGYKIYDGKCQYTKDSDDDLKSTLELKHGDKSLTVENSSDDIISAFTRLRKLYVVRQEFLLADVSITTAEMDLMHKN